MFRQAFGKGVVSDFSKRPAELAVSGFLKNVLARDVTNLTHEFVTHYGEFWLCGGSFWKIARIPIIPLLNWWIHTAVAPLNLQYPLSWWITTLGIIGGCHSVYRPIPFRWVGVAETFGLRSVYKLSFAFDTLSQSCLYLVLSPILKARCQALIWFLNARCHPGLVRWIDTHCAFS